ncbi:MAG: SDR family oxidoreductase [Pirellulales bacterium]|nr:SDR family oxidoreductase [Pirellulales bacterium]
MNDMAGQTVLVTGSTSGIGRAVALQLAESGAAVAIHGRNAAAAEKLADEISRSAGSVAGVFLADIATPDGCTELIAAVTKTCPALHAVCLIAGADTLTGSSASLSFEDKLQLLYDTDVRSTLLLGRGLGRVLKRRDGSSIVTTGWDQAATGMEGDSGELFGTIKGAVMAFTKSLAKSLAPHVRVNCVAPGWIKTAWGDQASKEWQERAVRECLLSRWGEAGDIADAVRWLISPQASFITGQIINLNGGFRTNQK